MYLKIVKNSFSCGTPFGSFWSVKYLSFGEKLLIRTVHHIFLESNYPEVIKNSYDVLSPEGSQKKLSAYGLIFVALVRCKPPEHGTLIESTEGIQKRRPGRFLNVLYAFNLGPVSREICFCNTTLSLMELSLVDKVVSDD